MSKDSMSAGVQDRQDNGATFSSVDCKCPGLCSQELYVFLGYDCILDEWI